MIIFSSSDDFNEVSAVPIASIIQETKVCDSQLISSKSDVINQQQYISPPFQSAKYALNIS